MAWRFHARRVRTGQWLTRDLPIENPVVSFELSGVGTLDGNVPTYLGKLRENDDSLLLEPWNTLIYLEDEGVLRWGGILIESEPADEGWRIECAQFATYPHGMPYLGSGLSLVRADPVLAMRHIWDHLQSLVRGRLGVIVEGSSSARIGTEKSDQSFERGDGTLAEFETGPYTLAWWDNIDCGSEIDSLTAEGPFEWVEEVAWSGEEPRTTIRAADRIGTQRHNLRFVMGENVVSRLSPIYNGDSYANEVVGIGAGEGRGSLRSVAIADDGRLRRVKMLVAKGVSSKDRLDRQTSEVLRKSQMLGEVDSIEIRNHRNAPIGSFGVGDSIQVEGELPRVGYYSEWHRITGYELRENNRAVLDIQRLEVA